MTRAIVLVAHGARDPRWAEPFRAVAERLRAAAPGRPVEVAFLELMAPDLASTLGALAALGATRIDIVPLLLGGGSHLREDLPRLVEQVRAAQPGLKMRLHPAIGDNPLVIDAIAAAALASASFGE
jgi:sirohydrochlorin cobaltochelatase